MGLIFGPIYLFAFALNIGISLFIARKLTQNFVWACIWAIALSFLFTFATRIPDFIYDAVTSNPSIYAVHKSVDVPSQDLVGFVGDMKKIRSRSSYFAISGLNGSGGSPRWGAPNVGESSVFDWLHVRHDVQLLNQNTPPEYTESGRSVPIVVVNQRQTSSHDFVRMEVWYEGVLHAEYEQRKRIWFADELWANAQGGHTILFLLKATSWNLLLAILEPDSVNPAKFLEEALIISYPERDVDVYQPTVTEHTADSTGSAQSIGLRSRANLRKHCARSDFPADAKLTSYSLRASFDDRHVRRRFPNPALPGYSTEPGKNRTPGFKASGISCGEDGYAVLLSANQKYHRILLLDRNLREIALLNSEVKRYPSDQVGRVLDFRQRDNVIAIKLLVTDDTGQDRVHQLELEHPVLNGAYATDAPPPRAG